MPIGMLQEIDDAPLAMYDEVAEQIRAQADPPAGLIVHTCAAKEGGGYRIYDVWDSREALERFRQERLMPVVTAVLARHGLTPESAPATMEVFDLHDFVAPRITGAAAAS
jgi:hypothetical protein